VRPVQGIKTPGGPRIPRTRAGPVPRARVPRRLAEGRPAHVRQREGGPHGSPQARCRREDRVAYEPGI